MPAGASYLLGAVGVSRGLANSGDCSGPHRATPGRYERVLGLRAQCTDALLAVPPVGNSAGDLDHIGSPPGSAGEAAEV
jgi:hypothetical protein